MDRPVLLPLVWGVFVMRSDLTTLGIPLSPPEVAVSGGKFSDALRVVRSVFLGRGYEETVQDIERAFRVPRRTAERIYAGQPVSGDTTLRLVFHEQSGPALVQEALQRLPLERRIVVAEALRDAARLAHLQAEQEQLARQLAERKAGR